MTRRTLRGIADRWVRRTLADRRGITLAEVLVALGVIFVGLIPLIAAAPLATSQVGEASLKTAATFLAQQQIEQVKNARWTGTPPATDRLGGAGSNGTAPVAPWPDETYGAIALGPQATYPRFRRITRIADCSVVACGGIATDPALNALRQVTVTVFFLPLTGTGQAGASEERISITTLMARRP